MIIAAVAIACAAIAPAIATAIGPDTDEPITACAGPDDAITLNTEIIEAAWLEHGLDPDQLGQLRPVPTPRSPGTEPIGTEPIDAGDPTDPRQMLSAVLSRLPMENAVYPSEQYFYFRLTQGGTRYAGNLRFTEAEQGAVHIGYYRHDRPREHVWHALLGDEDGVHISKGEDGAFTLHDTAHALSRSFTLATDWLAIPESLRLREDERAITGVLDESGVALVLLFNEAVGCFYYALNEEQPAADRFAPIGSHGRLFHGERTRFILLDEPALDRRLLVGVERDQIMANSFFDGPFDQVPPGLSIGAELIAAYPYVTLRGGIDDHGVFRELDDQRVAISPYKAYDTPARFIEWAEPILETHPGDASLPMTYEDKRHFHLKLLLGTALRSRYDPPWPESHLGQISLRWPTAHVANASRNAAPNSVHPPNR